ncbi:MAG: Rieske 2Fe-2S domain-containing protein, partial [Nitrosomonadaceae bacterium]
MSEVNVSPADIQQRLDLGILNLWYPVLPSWGVRDVPVGLTRLGENLVLWRDPEGIVHALEDRCP